MNYSSKIVCLAIGIAAWLPAHADQRLEAMKKVNVDGCVSAIALEENPPKDAKQVKPYCTCVYDIHFGTLTKTEQDQLWSGGPTPEKLEKSLPARLKAAQAQCRKKLGF